MLGDGALGEVELDLGEVCDSCRHHACFELNFELFESGVDLGRVVSIDEATTGGTGILAYLPLSCQPICISSLAGDRRLATRTIKTRNMTVTSYGGHSTCCKLFDLESQVAHRFVVIEDRLAALMVFDYDELDESEMNGWRVGFV